jgi:hypothetical protein
LVRGLLKGGSVFTESTNAEFTYVSEVRDQVSC